MQGDTATNILDAAERLCQSRGFGGFSFRDLATAVGVKSASVHYHFPTKQDLARGMIIRYRQRFETIRAEIDRKETAADGRIRRFFAELSKFYSDASRVCLAAVLSVETSVLDPPVRSELMRFFDENESWLEETLNLGVRQKRLRLISDASSTAMAMLSVIEGAIIASRATGDASRIGKAGECMLRQISIQQVQPNQGPAK